MEVTNKIKKVLADGEEVKYIAKRHWLTWFCWKHFWRYRTSTLFVSNRRFYYRFGFFTRKTHEMVIGKVESINVRETFWGRIFGYGHIKLMGSGEGEITLDWIRKPFELQRQIRSIGPDEAAAVQDNNKQPK